MANPTCEGVIRAELQYVQNGQQTENVFYFQQGGLVVTEGTMDELAGIIIAWADASWQPIIGNSTVINRLVLTDITTLLTPRKIYTAGLPLTGAGGAALPSFATFSVHKGGAGRGRSVSGRVYVPGIPTAATSGNVIAQASADEFVDALDLLVVNAFASPNTFMYGIISTQQNKQPVEPAEFVATPGHSYVDLYLDVQRRRATGRGD